MLSVFREWEDSPGVFAVLVIRGLRSHSFVLFSVIYGSAVDIRG